jgi:hypothetical protein
MIPNIADSSLKPGPTTPAGGRCADIADALADVIPDIREFPWRWRCLSIDEDRVTPARVSCAGGRTSAFLHLALEPSVTCLSLSSTAPGRRLDHHRLDDEAGSSLPEPMNE